VRGNRAALLASLDRVVAVSNSHFQAVRAGQMSLFGAETGVTENIVLPEVNDVDRREMLNWERNLIGLYLSDHPLSTYQKTLSQLVSYFSGQLPEAQHEEKVRVAGLITSIRPYQTKTGKPMGFVTLEDIQGVIDLVMFPRTWKRYSEMLVVGEIIIVEGKVDANSNPPKILVDSVRSDFELKVSADEMAPPWPAGQDGPPQPKPEPVPVPKPAPVPVQTPAPQVAESAPAYEVSSSSSTGGTEGGDEWDNADIPPPPDAFPPGWDEAWQPDFEAAKMAARKEPKFNKDEPVTLSPEVIPAPAPEPEADETAEAEAEETVVEAEAGLEPEQEARPGMVVQAVEASIHTAVKLPSLYAPVAQTEDRTRPPQHITVLLRPTNDWERNKRRIKILHSTLTSFKGRDRFSFQIFEDGKGHLIDFPNDTTRVCPELLTRLKNLMGEESWQIEEITFQQL
jgi:DNA polymerase-3 subunit alpha